LAPISQEDRLAEILLISLEDADEDMLLVFLMVEDEEPLLRLLEELAEETDERSAVLAGLSALVLNALPSEINIDDEACSELAEEVLDDVVPRIGPVSAEEDIDEVVAARENGRLDEPPISVDDKLPEEARLEVIVDKVDA
jgi:hypothetical protein